MDDCSSDDDGSLRDSVDLNNGNADGHLSMDAHASDVGDPIQSQQQNSEIAVPFVGMEFESEEAAKLFYMAYASRVGFSVRISKSRRSRNDESIIMRRFVCSKEGFHMKKDNFDDGKKRRKRATIREGCNAMIEVIQKYYGRWVVTKFVMAHNHMVSPPTRVRYVAPEEYADLEPFLGMEFQSHEDAQTFYYAYASRVGFDVRIRLSRRSTRDESFVMRRFVCTKEGFSTYEDNFDDSRRKRNRAPTREGCKAMFEVIKKECDKWVVSKLVTEHTHPLAVTSNKVHYIQSQSEVVVLTKTGAIAHEKATPQSNPALHVGDSATVSSGPPSVVQDPIIDSREVRQDALAGFEDSQSLLEYFKRMQAENPTFFYAFQVDKNNCLTSIFWADSRAKMAYYCFGDAVIFDTSYRDNKDMMPVVTFLGVNNHLQSVIFGCALLKEESESSYIWLFENWAVAMCGRPQPISLVVDPNETIKSAAAKVFPGTHVRFNKWCILSKCREKLSNICAINTSFEEEFEQCINLSETTEAFESCWSSILDKYGLRESTWLQSIYDIRHQWVSVYLKGKFSAEVSTVQRPQSMKNFFDKYFNTKTTLPVFISLFEQAMSSWSESETLEDFANAYTKPILKTPSLVLKQAAEYYTRTIFDIFQDEFVESLGYFGDKIEDGEISKYRVAKDENHSACIVTYNSLEKKASCSCCKFEVSGILCRHILRVFLIVGVRCLPEEYILKRWTKNAKGGLILDECVRFNDLCRDAIKYAREGASSLDIYKVAKEGLQMAFAEVVAAKKDIVSRCTM